MQKAAQRKRREPTPGGAVGCAVVVHNRHIITNAAAASAAARDHVRVVLLDRAVVSDVEVLTGVVPARAAQRQTDLLATGRTFQLPIGDANGVRNLHPPSRLELRGTGVLGETVAAWVVCVDVRRSRERRFSRWEPLRGWCWCISRASRWQIAFELHTRARHVACSKEVFGTLRARSRSFQIDSNRTKKNRGVDGVGAYMRRAKSACTSSLPLCLRHRLFRCLPHCGAPTHYKAVHLRFLINH